MDKVKGFTLFELIITLFILSIIITISLPSLSAVMVENRLATHYNHLLTAIALTRSEAIKRRQRVTICQSSDAASCTNESQQWHLGWVIFVDNDEDNNIDPNESIIQTQQTLPDITLSFGARTRIAYHPNGIAVGASNGTFLFCHQTNVETKKGLIVSISGRARKATETDLSAQSCIH